MYQTCISSIILLLLQLTITNSSTTDESALIAFKSHLVKDPGNVITRNWTSSTSVCTWIGIICSRKHGRVTGLSIPDMNLQGLIPPHLGNLSFLVTLDLSNNSFHGTLPHELSKLYRLKSIDLRDNELEGPFPSLFSSLPDLHSLSLSRNKFSGLIPASVANFSRLQELRLSLNSFEGEIPQEIGYLRAMTLLDLSGNLLTGPIPLTIFNISTLQIISLMRNRLSGQLPLSICDNLPNLQQLYMSSNLLDGSIPPSLQKCDKLELLSVGGNNFRGSIPREIGNLTRLSILHLGANELEGQIPMEIGNLQKLEILGLSYNYLGGPLPASIFNISAFKIFTVYGNQISGSLPTNIGQGTPNLQELYLGNNSLNGHLPDSLSNASTLTILDISTNNFTGSIPESLGNLQFLEILYLGDNKFINQSPSSELAFLTSLTKCRFLKELVVLENPLGGTIPPSVGNFSDSFEKFVAYGCRIQGEIPEEIGNLRSLITLSLLENEITGTIPSTVTGLEKLQQLSLRKNKIQGSISDGICGLQNLGALDLGQNLFSGALPACIGNMKSLRNLEIAFNVLNSSIPVTIWNLNLLTFNASSNMLSGHLPPEMGNLKAVDLIDLSMNNLSGNIPNNIGALGSLINISLAHNRLEGPIPDSLGKVLSLESLDFSYNNLTGEIPKSLEALTYLRYFDVSFNELSGEILNGGPFVNFTSMSFMSNEALCGDSRFQVPPCRLSPHHRPRRKRRLDIALSTALGGVLIVLALTVALILFRKQHKKRNNLNQTPSLNPHKRISYWELEKSTNGFSEGNLLGTGSCGNVYEGILGDRTPVAVKVFNLQEEHSLRSFDAECEVLRSLRHRNLIKVISTCSNVDFRALVLEYMPNGNLEKWLYSHNYFLDILQRLNIMIDVACALDYLHNENVTPVIHCDLKPSNVLLDKNMVGHVSDFGISKLRHEREESIAPTKTLATIGYMAPEYGSGGLVSEKSDVYSYGILLMETFTRRKPCDDMFSGESSLKSWIMKSYPDAIIHVVDPNLLIRGEESAENLEAKAGCLSHVMELALKCTDDSPGSRASIREAVMALNKIKLQLLGNSGEKEHIVTAHH